MISESKSGREAVAGKVFIDATGDGDPGCGFDWGHPETGLAQPMSLIALVDGLRNTGGVWKNLRLVATAEQIGIRE